MAILQAILQDLLGGGGRPIISLMATSNLITRIYESEVYC